jgi:hypothetical protein
MFRAASSNVCPITVADMLNNVCPMMVADMFYTPGVFFAP